MADQFNIRVQVEINKLQPDGRGWTGERLSINEQFDLGAADWVRISQILGQFHGLADEISKEKSGT